MRRGNCGHSVYSIDETVPEVRPSDNGKVYAIAMMRMVFLDSHYRTVLGKDVFAVMLFHSFDRRKLLPVFAMT